MPDAELEPKGIWGKRLFSLLCTTLPQENITPGQNFTGLEGMLMRMCWELKRRLETTKRNRVELQQPNETLNLNLPVNEDREGWLGLTQQAISAACHQQYTLSTRWTALSPAQAIVTDKKSALSPEHAQHGWFFPMNYSFKASSGKPVAFHSVRGLWGGGLEVLRWQEGCWRYLTDWDAIIMSFKVTVAK